MILATTTHNSVTVTLHQNWSRVVLIYTLVVALWALFLWLRGSNPSGGLLGALILNEAVVVIQGVLGLILVIQGQHPAQGLHFLYGIVALLTLPVAYFYGEGGTERRDSLVFGLAGLFLFGIAIRAVTTG
jgi:heme A synthase